MRQDILLSTPSALKAAHTAQSVDAALQRCQQLCRLPRVGPCRLSWRVMAKLPEVYRFCTSYKVFQNNQLAGNSPRQQKKYPGHKTWWDVHGQTQKMTFGEKKVSVDDFLCTSISSEVGSGVLQYHRNRLPHSVVIVEVLDQPSLTSCSCAPSMTKLLPNKASRIFSRGS